MGALDFLFGRRPAAPAFHTDPCDCSCDGERWRPAGAPPPARRPGTPVLDVHVAERRDGRRLVTHDLRLRVTAGEVVALRGADPAALLRIVAGLDRDFVGSLHIDGEARHGPSSDIALVRGTPAWPGLRTVGEVVASASGARSPHDTRTCALLKQVGLHGIEASAPSALSPEQAHRVALAQALYGAPRVLLFDAPFRDVDDAARARLLDLVASLVRQHGIAALVAPRDAREAAASAARVVATDEPGSAPLSFASSG